MKEGIPKELEKLIKKGALVAEMASFSFNEITVPRTSEGLWLSDCISGPYPVGDVMIYQFDPEAIYSQVENAVSWIHGQYGVTDKRNAVVIYKNVIRLLSPGDAMSLAVNGNIILRKVAQEIARNNIQGVAIKASGTTARGIAEPRLSDLDINMQVNSYSPEFIDPLAKITDRISSELHTLAVKGGFSHIDLPSFQ